MRINRPEESEVLIQKLPSDMGIHRNPRKGTLNAPEEILEGLSFEEEVFISEIFPDEFSLEKTHRRIFENTEELLGYERSLVSIGGDHSVTFPVLKALKEEFPEMNLVWLDAHLDLKEKVDGHVSHDVVVRELIEKEIFSPEEVTFIGITEIDHDEKSFLEEHDIDVFRPGETDEFMQEYDSGESCYLSVDIDVLSEKYAPGTGYTDGQLSVDEVEKVIENVDPDFADLVEVAPPFDENGKTLENSERILKQLLENSGRV